ncbi:MAG TPA: phosphopyruvate hydratase [Amycolatopsis sp.]|nr:phosphopyruvate hydratase [Amycolatopsis sp.]
MPDSTITKILGWEALDSRGNPTVGCEVTLSSGAVGAALAPSGASTGAHEAHELRDGGRRFGGKGVREAISHLRGELADAVRGKCAADQRSVDEALRAVDGTANLSRLGANAVLALSLAVRIAAAADADVPLWQHALGPGEPIELPLPMVNIISGGAHAGRAIDIQDVLVSPLGADSFPQALEWVDRVRRETGAELDRRALVTSLVADEGGYGPSLSSNSTALEIVALAIERAGLIPGQDVAIALDIAATQLYDPASGRYRLSSEGRDLTAAEWAEELTGWTQRFPVISVEDAMAEDDWAGWQIISESLRQKVQLVGDDLFTTNSDRLERGVDMGVANAILVKPNQIGTVSEAHAVVAQAREAGYATVLSARSGETEDAWLADLAVGWRTGQIKVGSLTRSERTAKWNRLLRLAAELGDGAGFAGRQALR